jgi:hypothetical protein
MMTWLRVYVTLGLAGCLIFGGLMVWAENRQKEWLRRPMNYLTLICLPALLIGGLIVAVGSIGLG